MVYSHLKILLCDVCFLQQHMDNQSRVYYYTSIEGTTFSVAIVIPEYTQKYVDMSSETVPVTEGKVLYRRQCV